MERARVTVFDTTLRDGEQSPGCSMNMREKMRIARQLDRLGVDVIEAGFPIASEGDFEAVRAIAETGAPPDHRGACALLPRRHRARVGSAEGRGAAADPRSLRPPTFT